MDTYLRLRGQERLLIILFKALTLDVMPRLI